MANVFLKGNNKIDYYLADNFKTVVSDSSSKALTNGLNSKLSKPHMRLNKIRRLIQALQEGQYSKSDISRYLKRLYNCILEIIK